MTMTPGPATWTSLNAQVAAEVRAEMGRRGMSNAELARLLGVSEAWTTRRLGRRAESPLSLVDLQRIAAALRVPLAVFFPSEIRDVVPAPAPRSTHGCPTVDRTDTVQISRPRDNRPPGRALAGAGAGISRTAHVDRTKRRRRDR